MASTWGNNTWGSNEWGDDNVTVILTGQSTTSSVGSLEAFNEEGWGRQEWGNSGWGVEYAAQLTGQSATSSVGSLEAFNEDWSAIDDMRLSDKDMNAAKTMNTHLHILEAYTTLLKIYDNDILRNSLKDLVERY